MICVERSVAGTIEWLPLADQHKYREWTGCFSLLGLLDTGVNVMNNEDGIIKRLSRLEKETLSRLVRVESKLVRGFEELGISTDKDDDWLSVDNAARIVYVSTIGRSLMVLLSDMGRLGATHYGDNYKVIHKGVTIAVVELRKVV